jgi:two-component system chemotaxis response regulator CheY
MRDLLAMVLRRAGFEVVEAADGDAALDAILKEGADGLVADLRMPRLDGLTLCRCLRALSAYQTLPIVVYTGAAPDDERLREFREFAGLRVLNKPMGLSEIVPSLAELMNHTAPHRTDRAVRILPPPAPSAAAM